MHWNDNLGEIVARVERKPNQDKGQMLREAKTRSWWRKDLVIDTRQKARWWVFREPKK